MQVWPQGCTLPDSCARASSWWLPSCLTGFLPPVGHECFSCLISSVSLMTILCFSGVFSLVASAPSSFKILQLHLGGKAGLSGLQYPHSSFIRRALPVLVHQHQPWLLSCTQNRHVRPAKPLSGYKYQFTSCKSSSRILAPNLAFIVSIALTHFKE